MAVHWGGIPIDIDALKEVAGNVPIIEDCAHAFGVEYKGKLIGTHGNLCEFSLQAIKHLTTIDGGLLFTSNKEQSKLSLCLSKNCFQTRAKIILPKLPCP